MSNDNIFNTLKYSDNFSAKDWDALVKLKFKKYFRNERIFLSNKDLLRTEIVNYVKISQDDNYIELLDWTFSIFKQSIKLEKDISLIELAKSFYEVTDTDVIWITNVVIQPDSSSFSERDYVSYGFKVMDDILEGVFKPRFRLLDKFVHYRQYKVFSDNSKTNFGLLITNFLNSETTNASLYLNDPIFSISTNQWRNIASHKSYKIEKDLITIEYGRKKPISIQITYKQFDKIINWIQNIYLVLRLAEELIYLNYTKKIVELLGGADNINVRFESSLLHIIHNLQIVGFKFVSTREKNKTFEINLKKKLNDNLKNSLIHASQCLDQLAVSIYNDTFTRKKYTQVKVSIVDDNKILLASASIDINIAMQKVKSAISLEQYIANMDFEFIELD